MFSRFEDIEAWKKGRKLIKEIYRISSENDSLLRDFALRDQIRRAAISVVSNIAEGFEREGNKEFYQFLSIAKGSIGEIKAQLYVAMDVGYISEEEFRQLYQQSDEVGRIINGLMNHIKESKLKGRKYIKTVPS